MHALRAGDTRLPHGRALNRGDQPRVAQYITMYPPPADALARRPRPRGHVHDGVPPIDIGAYEYRKRWFEECQGGLKSLEGAPSGRSEPAVLSGGALARRLAGLEEWPVTEAPPVAAYAMASGMPPWESGNLSPSMMMVAPTPAAGAAAAGAAGAAARAARL